MSSSVRWPAGSCSTTSGGDRCSSSTFPSRSAPSSPAASWCPSRETRRATRRLDRRRPVGRRTGRAGDGDHRRRRTTAGPVPWCSASSRLAAVALTAFAVWESRVDAPDARRALLPQPTVQRGKRHHHAGVLRPVRIRLPVDPVPPVRPRLLPARRRSAHPAVRRGDDRRGARSRRSSSNASAPSESSSSAC